MNKHILTVAAFCAGLTTTAFAADMPLKAVAPVPYSWSGWIGVEYLQADRTGMNVPPLVTTFPTALIGPGFPGALGVPGTQIAFGNRKYLNDFSPGIRVNAGLFLDPMKTWSVEGSVIALQQNRDNRTFASTPSLSVYVPVSNPNFPPGTGNVGFPTLPLTNVATNLNNQFFGADINVRYGVIANASSRVDLFVGYRYLNLRDSLNLNTSLDLDNFFGVPAGTFGAANTRDSFSTRNDFNGVNLGASGSRSLGQGFTISGKAAVALGRTSSTTEIFGSNNYAGGILAGTLPPGQGIFAQTSNNGRFASNQFAYVPEVTVKLGYDFSERFRATIGYNYLYWSSVHRAGDQIDTGASAAFGFAAPPGRPAFLDRSTSFSTQAITLGVEYKL